jgi:hypothetical protein
MSDRLGELRFLPWLRRGLAARLAETAAGGSDPRPSLPVTLRVRRDDTPEDVSTTIRFYGPGDVAQLHPAQVIATDPRPFTTDFEPNHFAAVVLDAPELPWLFSPDASPPADNPAGRLRPWLCLVVVRQEVARIVADGSRPLPVLELADAAGELPDLAESWAWAHAQLAGTAAPVADAVAGPPERTLARLLCSRRLAARTAYLACVVPTFAAGRQAGLGEKVTAQTEPAWDSPSAGRVTLPVYHTWEFTTGPTGDFETLVRRLTPYELGPEVGRRPLDISHPGPGLPEADPDAAGSVLGLEGALRSLTMEPSQGPGQEFERQLERQLQAPAGAADTVLTPPLYGAAQAGVTSIAADTAPPAWLRELNLDPRHRAAAAFGARVVQEQQEQLMASAWDQAGDLRQANRLLREAQLGRAVASSVREQRLAHLPPTTLLRVTAPLHGRVQAPTAVATSGAASLLGGVRESLLPEATVSNPFRRVLRPLGPLGRRIGEDRPVAELVDGLAQGAVPMPIAEVVSGTVELDRVGTPKLAQLTDGLQGAAGWRRVTDFRDGTDQAVPAPVAPAPPLPGELSRALLPRRRDDLPGDVEETVPVRLRRLGGINARFRAASRALQAYLVQPGPGPRALRAAAELPVGQVAAELLEPQGRLDPEVTVPSAILPRVTVPVGTQPHGPDPLAPVTAAPRFPQPMFEPLRAVSQDLVLPGAEHVPPDTVGVVVANARFIEAYMVGLNHELGRELRWRGLPTDPGGTFFQQFWDVRGRDPAAPEPATDIPPIAEWTDPAARLGDHATRVGGRGMLVLLIRGELLRRYPTATVYAVKAADRHTLGSQELYPEFRGMLEPDLAFIGFGLDEATARGRGGDPGWFFVIQEQVVEPRFGFDEPSGEGPDRFGGAPGHWRDMTWGHVVSDEAAFARLSHVPVASPPLNALLRNLSLDGATWGMNAAHMAQITLQPPVRIAVHADAVLPRTLPTPHLITAVTRRRGRVVEIGGVDPFGESWRLTEAAAIAAIRAGSGRFLVDRPDGELVEAVVARTRRGREYLATSTEAAPAAALLGLPELPA